MRLNVKRILIYVSVTIIIVWTLFPIYWMINVSFKRRVDVYTWPPSFVPPNPTIEYWIKTFTARPTLTYYRNTIITSLLSTIILLALSIPAAYALARFTFRRREDIAFLILSFRFLPAASVVISIYIFINMMGLLDSLVALAMIYAAMNIPIAVWILRSYLMEIPPELEESYMIDGHTRWEAIWRITLPLAKPGIIVSSILSLCFSWNEFLFAVLLTSSVNAKTLPVALSEYVGGEWGYCWNEIAVLSLTSMLPVLLFLILIQKHLARGLTMGAVR